MNKRLNILFLCGWYPSRVLPNNGDFIQRHAEAVCLLHNVSVLHIISDERLTQNIEITSEKINGIQTYIGYIKKSSNPVFKALHFYKAYKQIIKEIGDFNVIHLNELFPFGLFTFLQKTPFIISEHWTGYHQPQSKSIRFWQRFLSKRIAKRARFICPVSKELQQSMENLNIRGRYEIVPNVVNTKMFYPTKNNNNKFTIVHISNMVDTHKNISGIIEAVSHLNFEYELILIGENSSRYKTVSDAFGISKNSTFIEHISHNSVPKYLQQADVYVSFSNYETWGIVMVEALACGTPVISTKTGILNELNVENFVKIIDINDTQALTKRLNEIKQSPSINKNEMYEFVKTKFSNKIIAERISALYLETLK